MFTNGLLKPGTQALTFRLLDHHGRSIGLDDFQDCQGVVVLFFSTDWLKADIELLRLYSQAYAEFEANGLAVLAVSGINWETMHLLAQRLQVPFPVLFDPCCHYSAKYGSMLIPKYVTGRSVYVLTPQGRVLFSRKGIAPPSDVLAAFKSQINS